MLESNGRPMCEFRTPLQATEIRITSHFGQRVVQWKSCKGLLSKSFNTGEQRIRSYFGCCPLKNLHFMIKLHQYSVKSGTDCFSAIGDRVFGEDIYDLKTTGQVSRPPESQSHRYGPGTGLGNINWPCTRRDWSSLKKRRELRNV